jgi:D-beta-D-heptose 7-phosphate kinase/D-beta-D-heptose 1-phosphate adenosyltransferase
MPPSRVLTWAEAAEAAAGGKSRGALLVFTNGCFDLLHPGHLHVLRSARALGDMLIVGVNSDASVRRLKGPTRPLLPLAARMDLLAELRCVDMVVPFEEDTPLELIRTLMPDVLVKGGDYRPGTVVGGEEVESRGGRVVLIPLLEGFSTTKLAGAASRSSDENTPTLLDG